MQTTRHIAFITLLLHCCLPVGMGQNTQASASDTSRMSKVQEMEDVVVTAQYTPNSINKSTYKIKVVDSAKVQAMAAVNLKDALSNELNIRFSQDPILGSGMSLQGLSGQNVKILIDGVAIIGRQNGNLDLSQINLNNIERIEIVEGPLSVSYGTNALAGVINIITKKPKSNVKGVDLNLYYETNNTYNAGLNSFYRKRNHGFALNLNRNYFNGWNMNEKYYALPVKTLADTSRFKNWKPKEQYFGEARYSFDTKNFALDYRAAFFNEEIINRGFPMKPYYETAFDDYYKTRRTDNTLYTNIKFRKFKSFNNTLAFNYYSRNKTTLYKNLTDLSEQLAADASLQDTAVFSQVMARGSFLKSKPYEVWDDTISSKNIFNYDIGYDLSYNYAEGKRIKAGSQTIGDYALFASSEIQPIRNLVLRPGVRYSYNTVYKSPVTPSFNIKYNTLHWSFRASYAKGFRAPDLKELYFEFVDVNHRIFGNTGLKAERSDNYNFNTQYISKGEEKAFSCDLSGFYNHIDNLITLALLNVNQYTYINVGTFKSFGVTLSSEYTVKKVILSAGASLIARYNALSAGFNSVEKYSYSPEFRASARYKIEKWKMNINCFYKYTGRLPGLNQDAEGNIVQAYIDHFQMLDANISKQFFQNRIIVSCGAKNIMNVNNVRSSMSGGTHSGNSSSSPIAMGRTYFIKLQYAFRK